MGVKIKTAGVMSIKTPTNKRIILIISIIINGLSESEIKLALTSCGMFS